MLQPVAPIADAAPLLLALLGRTVPAGFPSPADDYLEGEIDLARLLVTRVSGHSMSGAGILDGDLLVVDRSLAARHGHVVVATLDGEMTVKRLRRTKAGRTVLVAEHPDYPPLVVGEADQAEVWGVVVGCVRKVRV